MGRGELKSSRFSRLSLFARLNVEVFAPLVQLPKDEDTVMFGSQSTVELADIVVKSSVKVPLVVDTLYLHVIAVPSTTECVILTELFCATC